MRTRCPHCGGKFDVPHRAVLAEAERLKHRKHSRPDSDPEPNGNVLSPHDLAAKRARDEAVARRLASKNF